MKNTDTTAGIPAPSPHPLACALADELTHVTKPRALLWGFGSGRNVPVLLACGARITLVEPDDARRAVALEQYAACNRLEAVASLAEIDRSASFAAVLATHALLHGTPHSIGASLNDVASRLLGGAALAIVLGSQRDPRYGTGRRIDRDTYAPFDGSEAGVPHAYFDERGARALLAAFAIESLVEDDASHTAGSWAHTPDEIATLRHWFVRARSRDQ